MCVCTLMLKERVNAMLALRKIIAMIRYKKGMQKMTSLLNDFADTYRRNEELIQEARQLIEEDKRLQEEDKKE